MLLSKQPSYDTLKSFGCLCYVSTLSHNRRKFEAREKGCVFLGYAQNQKGYKLLDLDTKRVFVSRDVRFHEHQFLFAHSPLTSDFPFFPPATPPLDTFLIAQQNPLLELPHHHHFPYCLRLNLPSPHLTAFLSVLLLLLLPISPLHLLNPLLFHILLTYPSCPDHFLPHQPEHLF